MAKYFFYFPNYYLRCSGKKTEHIHHKDAFTLITVVEKQKNVFPIHFQWGHSIFAAANIPKIRQLLRPKKTLRPSEYFSSCSPCDTAAASLDYQWSNTTWWHTLACVNLVRSTAQPCGVSLQHRIWPECSLEIFYIFSQLKYNRTNRCPLSWRRLHIKRHLSRQ